MHDIFLNLQNWFQAHGMLGLGLNAWLESFLVLPPPDILLIAMNIAQPQKALQFALVTSIGSAFGGLTGWTLGKIGGRPFFNWIFRKKKDLFKNVEDLYAKWGTIAVVVAAMTPVPYNVFAWASGILNMNWFLFTLISLICRGARFFFISILLMIFGEAIKQNLKLIVLAGSILLVIAYIVIFKFMKKNDIKKEEQITENSKELEKSSV